jgi:hypothetical protein
MTIQIIYISMTDSQTIMHEMHNEAIGECIVNLAAGADDDGCSCPSKLSCAASAEAPLLSGGAPFDPPFSADAQNRGDATLR